MTEHPGAAAERHRFEKARGLEEMTDVELLTHLLKPEPQIPPDEAEAEIAMRQIQVTKELTAALEDFKRKSSAASDRLEGLARWLIAFTVAIVLLTVAVAVLTGFLVYRGH